MLLKLCDWVKNSMWNSDYCNTKLKNYQYEIVTFN